MIANWLLIETPEHGRHIYAFHDDALDARAQQILADWNVDERGEPDAGLAASAAQMAAGALARAEQGVPEAGLMFSECIVSLMTVPLHPDFLPTVAGVHWQDGMPSLP